MVWFGEASLSDTDLRSKDAVGSGEDNILSGRSGGPEGGNPLVDSSRHYKLARLYANSFNVLQVTFLTVRLSTFHSQ